MIKHTSGGNNIAIGQNVMDDTDVGSTSSDSDNNLLSVEILWVELGLMLNLNKYCYR